MMSYALTAVSIIATREQMDDSAVQRYVRSIHRCSGLQYCSNVRNSGLKVFIINKDINMKTLKNKITENRLREIINESVEDVLNRIGIINETTVPLETYKTRVDGLRFQLVENWCLCKWCQLFNPESENFAHWTSELKACIDNLKFLDIKNGIDKRRTLTRMLVNDYDYNSANMIERIVRDKFVRENINDNNQKVRVCTEFADNINGLIDAISLDAIDSDEYIQNTFG